MGGLIITLLILPVLTLAQESPETHKDSISKSEPIDGTTDITGKTGPTEKSARENWALACDEWKKEFRSDNKAHNQIININCGDPVCGGSAGFKSCASTGLYKIKPKD